MKVNLSDIAKLITKAIAEKYKDKQPIPFPRSRVYTAEELQEATENFFNHPDKLNRGSK